VALKVHPDVLQESIVQISQSVITSLTRRTDLAKRSPIPGCIKARGSDEDAINFCCRKAKRDAETLSSKASELASVYEKALEVRDAMKAGQMTKLEAREAFPMPGCIKARADDEDAFNICCRKAKRDAEAGAAAAAEAYTEYSANMKLALA